MEYKPNYRIENIAVAEEKGLPRVLSEAKVGGISQVSDRTFAGCGRDNIPICRLGSGGNGCSCDSD